MKVERRQYRFRIVNASNARFYNLKLSNGMSFIQIGGDGSYLPAPATLTEALIARRTCRHFDRLLKLAGGNKNHSPEHRQSAVPGWRS